MFATQADTRHYSAVGFSIRHRTFARCSYPVIMSLGVKLDLSQPIPTGPGDAASRYYRPKPLRLGVASTMGFLTKSLWGPSDGGKSPESRSNGMLGHEPNTWCLSPPKSSIYQGDSSPYRYPYQKLLYNRRPIFAVFDGTPLF